MVDLVQRVSNMGRTVEKLKQLYDHIDECMISIDIILDVIENGYPLEEARNLAYALEMAREIVEDLLTQEEEKELAE